MARYRCSGCGIEFEVDWSRETLCANCGSLQQGNPLENPDWECSKCKSIAFNHEIKGGTLKCPECKKAGPKKIG